MIDGNQMNAAMPVSFFRYPPVGEADWAYTYATAQVRVLQSMLLAPALLADMANADDFGLAAELLSSTEYAMPTDAADAAVEDILLARRSAVRKLFSDLIDKPAVAEFFRSRADFANVRLALRRILTDRPVGTDYCNEGNVPADAIVHAFENEDYSEFPDAMGDAVEAAVLSYYADKRPPAIDMAVDAVEAACGLEVARRVGSVFLEGLVGLQIDLSNIRTMLRLQWAGSQTRTAFIDGGFLDVSLLLQGLDSPVDVVPDLFTATAYSDVVEAGTAYLKSHDSFLRLETLCNGHLLGYLRETDSITAGHQPVIAYLLQKEHEIRTVRMILACKRNQIDVKLIRDRIPEVHS
ncbi:MAG TPA: V-type ATPase subunit [Sedimentisphaerales bacterium]|nr:V-type ATPase subunit [Sedimentisphaerales bacterium]